MQIMNMDYIGLEGSDLRTRVMTSAAQHVNGRSSFVEGSLQSIGLLTDQENVMPSFNQRVHLIFNNSILTARLRSTVETMDNRDSHDFTLPTPGPSSPPDGDNNAFPDLSRSL